MHRPNSSLAVLKFGGAALATAEHVIKAARLVAHATERYPQIVVVVSAMGKTTDSLIALATTVCNKIASPEYDLIAAAGEQIAAGLMALAIQGQGHASQALLASQVRILTDDTPGAAEINTVEIARLTAALLRGEIPVVAGFQGVGSRGQLTTLGRGGSDTTAVAIAAALGASICEFYKDVDGVYDADPHIAPSAAKYPSLTYDAMLALAQGGARVLSTSAVSLAQRHSVPLLIRSAFTDAVGTSVSAFQKGHYS